MKNAQAAEAFLNLSSREQDVLGALFVRGPLYDGDINSKAGRDSLVELGLAERGFGWNWLARAGVEIALNADVKNWADQRWHKKQVS